MARFRARFLAPKQQFIGIPTSPNPLFDGGYGKTRLLGYLLDREQFPVGHFDHHRPGPRFVDCSLNGPSISQPTSQAAIWDFETFSGVDDSHLHAAIFNNRGFFAVPNLFGLRRPATVIGSIRPISITTVDRMLCGGLRAHVLDKALKAALPAFSKQPAVTYSDPPRAIPGIGVDFRTVAPRLHVHPSWVGGMPAAANDKAMTAIAGGSHLAAQTPTALGVAIAQRRACHNHNRSTVASTLPEGSGPTRSFSRLGKRYDGQSPEALFRDVLDLLRQCGRWLHGSVIQATNIARQGVA
jgi:hypothetical protein